MRILLTGALFLAPILALAVSAPDFEPMPGYGRFPYQGVFTAISQPGQSKHDFMLEIAPRFREFSDATGFEACAAIGWDGERYSVVVGSNLSHVGCIVNEERLVEGARDTGESIHSHGIDRPFSMSRVDLRLSGSDPSDRSGRWMAGQNISRFSMADLDDAPGYLAIPGGALFHDGKGRIIALSPGHGPLNSAVAAH